MSESDTHNPERQPKDELTYVFMVERIRDHMHNRNIKGVAKDIGITYRTLRLIANYPDYKAKIDDVSDIYKRLFW